MNNAWKGHGWTRLTADGFVGRGESLLFGLHMRVSVTGAQLSLYDGQDAGGRLIGIFEGEANIDRLLMFGKGLHIERGIFADLGTNVDEVLLIWDAAPVD